MADSDYKVLSVYSFTHFLIHCPGNVFVALITLIIADFDITIVEFGLILTILSFSSSLLSPVAGALADYFGLRIFPPLSAMITGIISLIIGLFGGKSLIVLIICLVTMSFSVTLFHPSSMAMISNRYHRRRSRAFSVFQIGGQSGVGVGPLTVAILLWLGKSSDPFLAYLLWNFPILIMSTVMTIMQLKDPTIGVTTKTEENILDKINDESSPPLSSMKLLLIPAFLVLLLVLALDSFGTGLYRNYLILFMEEERHVQQATAVFYFSMLKLLGLPGTLIGGYWGDKYGAKPVLIGAFAIATVGLILLLILSNPIFLPLIFLLIAMGQNAIMPTMDNWTAKITPLRARGTAYGFTYLAPVVGSVAPFLGALIIETSGYTLTFLIAIGISAIVIMLLFLVHEPSDPENVQERPTVN